MRFKIRNYFCFNFDRETVIIRKYSVDLSVNNLANVAESYETLKWFVIIKTEHSSRRWISRQSAVSEYFVRRVFIKNGNVERVVSINSRRQFRKVSFYAHASRTLACKIPLPLASPSHRESRGKTGRRSVLHAFPSLCSDFPINRRARRALLTDPRAPRSTLIEINVTRAANWSRLSFVCIVSKLLRWVREEEEAIRWNISRRFDPLFISLLLHSCWIVELLLTGNSAKFSSRALADFRHVKYIATIKSIKINKVLHVILKWALLRGSIYSFKCICKTWRISSFAKRAIAFETFRGMRSLSLLLFLSTSLKTLRFFLSSVLPQLVFQYVWKTINSTLPLTISFLINFSSSTFSRFPCEILVVLAFVKWFPEAQSATQNHCSREKRKIVRSKEVLKFAGGLRVSTQFQRSTFRSGRRRVSGDF